MKPFFQGKLDVFCAIYAVLNGLKITHNIGVLPARDILHETLLKLADQPEVFRAVLDQRTDYISLVDAMLNIQCKVRPLRVDIPFPHTTGPMVNNIQVFDHCTQWLEEGPKRAIIFRFLRYLTPEAPPLNRHWTTAHKVEGDILHFFDCSHESEAIFSLKRDAFVTHSRLIHKECLLCLEPHSIRFIRSAF